ncbi:MAG: phosphoribosylformylglycinamidine synthase subunit PurQ [Clostridiales bacterium]|nr:phosphoribosylformylglycinamidine synthase subunit PurQ [Clostridiales bacterium]
MVRRIYVEKKDGFDVGARELKRELETRLGIKGIRRLRILDRYDVDGIAEELFERAKWLVFANKGADTLYEDSADTFLEKPEAAEGAFFFGIEPMPGQFDQPAKEAVTCIRLLDPSAKPVVQCAKFIIIEGSGEEGSASQGIRPLDDVASQGIRPLDDVASQATRPLDDAAIRKIKSYCINPVAYREASLDLPETLAPVIPPAPPVATIEGFCGLGKDALTAKGEELGFAMSEADLAFVQKYFKEDERRDPTITELKAIDTYWSDHCRHSTFLTRLTDVAFEEGPRAGLVKEAYEDYLRLRGEVYGEEGAKGRPVTLMDMATIGAKYIKKNGLLDDLEESEEVNACCVRTKAEVMPCPGARPVTEDWLFMFKNETHNHPTEIEPFGGAATCLGGGIRDPLSGRAYVHQAMRITGCGNPYTSIENTLPGKLTQYKITRDAAAGYSSYGNQVGICSGYLDEIYDDSYVAKRMELGALVGAAPAANVVREAPVPGDHILIVGGPTGRDGIGGATSSSKQQTEKSVNTASAEVQKGDAALEREFIRLFRRGEASRLIKRCNDFGAGGVSVAIGELAEGIDVDLDKVTVKYDGLDGTELAISESQERMAVVIAERDLEEFRAYAAEENVEVTSVARVTDTGRFRMYWRGDVIFDLSREFLDTGGVLPEQAVLVKSDALSLPGGRCTDDAGMEAVNGAQGAAAGYKEVDGISSLPGDRCLAGAGMEAVNGAQGAAAGYKEVDGTSSLPGGRCLVGAGMEAVNGAQGDAAIRKDALLALLSDLKVASKRSLAERFDSTIDSGTLLAPFGGERGLTPALGMAAKFPVLSGDTNTASLMAYGFDPAVSRESVFHSAMYAVLDSYTKICAMGGDPSGIRLSFQEYFPKLEKDEARWAWPFMALLGALRAQVELDAPSIGGKDSMSGSYGDLDVVPMLASFAVCVCDARHVLSPEFKKPGSQLCFIECPKDQNGVPDFVAFKANMRRVHELAREGKILAANTVSHGGLFASVAKMAMGNGIGAVIAAADEAMATGSKGEGFSETGAEEQKRRSCALDCIYSSNYGSLLLEIDGKNDPAALLDGLLYEIVGETVSASSVEVKAAGQSVALSIDEIIGAWEAPLAGVFPAVEEGRAGEFVECYTADSVSGGDTLLRGANKTGGDTLPQGANKTVGDTLPRGANKTDGDTLPRGANKTDGEAIHPAAENTAAAHMQTLSGGETTAPRVLIPIFPGTTGEDDGRRAFERAGAEVRIAGLITLTPEGLEASIRRLADEIKAAQILMLTNAPAMYIEAVFRNPYVAEAVEGLLEKRDGLILGVGGGFSALLRLGLLPGGRIIVPDVPDVPNAPGAPDASGAPAEALLTTAEIGRHVSRLVRVSVRSKLSPWLAGAETGRVYTLPVSHTEGRLAASEEAVAGLAANGQIATQYAGTDPFGSVRAIEGLTSPDGRILGRMGHSERCAPGLYVNVPGNYDDRLFVSGVGYFR